ncbi:hypothetical protein SNEBB_010047 [Seison nebaliae]|nr:hypothetical protein SNEBB_010047 [Seison nebaliae]
MEESICGQIESINQNRIEMFKHSNFNHNMNNNQEDEWNNKDNFDSNHENNDYFSQNNISVEMKKDKPTMTFHDIFLNYLGDLCENEFDSPKPDSGNNINEIHLHNNELDSENSYRRNHHKRDYNEEIPYTDEDRKDHGTYYDCDYNEHVEEFCAGDLNHNEVIYFSCENHVDFSDDEGIPKSDDEGSNNGSLGGNSNEIIYRNIPGNIGGNFCGNLDGNLSGNIGGNVDDDLGGNFGRNNGGTNGKNLEIYDEKDIEKGSVKQNLA